MKLGTDELLIRRGSRNFRQGGGSDFPKNFNKKKKEGGGGGGGDGGLWLFSFLQKNGLNQFTRQLFAYKFVFGGGGGG